MSVRRLSISVSPEVEQTIRNAADQAGKTVSAWLADVATHAAKIQDGLAAMQEYQAELGAFTEEELSKAHQALIEDGVIQENLSVRPTAS